MIVQRARSGRSVLVNERLQAVRRLSTLLADLDGIDQAGGDQLDELRAGLSSALARKPAAGRGKWRSWQRPSNPVGAQEQITGCKRMAS